MWCFLAIERNSKLVLNIAIGKRDQPTTDVFVEGARDALAPGCQVRLTTAMTAGIADRGWNIGELLTSPTFSTEKGEGPAKAVEKV
jgi:hypothetical protein